MIIRISDDGVEYIIICLVIQQVQFMKQFSNDSAYINIRGQVSEAYKICAHNVLHLSTMYNDVVHL